MGWHMLEQETFIFTWDMYSRGKVEEKKLVAVPASVLFIRLKLEY